MKNMLFPLLSGEIPWNTNITCAFQSVNAYVLVVEKVGIDHISKGPKPNRRDFPRRISCVYITISHYFNRISAISRPSWDITLTHKYISTSTYSYMNRERELLWTEHLTNIPILSINGTINISKYHVIICALLPDLWVSTFKYLNISIKKIIVKFYSIFSFDIIHIRIQMNDKGCTC
jgi:hypothetical protein